MDYYTGSGTDGLSLQDMIECDIRSNYQEPLPNGEMDMQLSVTAAGLEFASNSLSDGIVSTSEMGKLTDLTTDIAWMQTNHSENSVGLETLVKTENTDPNLLVDPATGTPISEAHVNTDGALMHVVTSVSASQTLNQMNTTLNQPQRIIQTAQGHFISIPANLQHAFIQQVAQPQNVTSNTLSPLRQHLQNLQPASQPASPVSTTHQTNVAAPYIVTNATISTNNHKATQKSNKNGLSTERVYPKPVYSYSCLIAMALKNSETGCLPVSDIYSFMTENFPYFKTAPDGWKNSVRHNLSLNKCFEKIENPKSNGNTKKGCLWAMNPAKIEKMEEEIVKWRKKDPASIKKSMSKPEVLELLEKGQIGCPGSPRHHPGSSPPSAPSTPKHNYNNENNNSKVTIVATAPTAAAPTTILTQQREEPEHQVTSINANINVIELKPKVSTTLKEDLRQIKVEDMAAMRALTSDDLSILENNLALDPSLNDLALQNGLFDEFTNEELADLRNMTDSPLSFTFNPISLSSSPITVQAGSCTPIKDDKIMTTLQSLGTNYILSNGTATPTTSSPGGLQISHTLTATT